MIRIYTCPNCGQKRVYKAGSNELVCESCGAKALISTITVDEASGAAQGVKTGPDAITESELSTTIKCPGCGADLELDDAAAAIRCGFCDNTVVIDSRLSGVYRPARILPFQISEKEAKDHFKSWKKSGPLTPKSFKEATARKVSGSYVPFWLYDYEVSVSMTAQAKRTEKTTANNAERTTMESYEVVRDTLAVYKDVPQVASENYPDVAMKILEPFNYKDFQTFTAPYLAGYTAEHFTKTAEDLRAQVQAEIRKDAEDAAKATITGYDQVNVTVSNTVFQNERVESVLLPIYKLDYDYQGKKYPIYMNGQTGEIQGKLPKSKLKTLLWFAIPLAAVFLITMILGLVLTKPESASFFRQWYSWLIFGGIAGILSLLIVSSKQGGGGPYDRRNYMENQRVQVLSAKDTMTERKVTQRDLNKK